MKKWIAMVVCAVMLLTLAAPALAAPSIGPLNPTITVVVVGRELPEGWIVGPVSGGSTGKPVVGKDPIATQLINDVNDPAKPMTAQEVLWHLILRELAGDEIDLERLIGDDKELLELLADFDFVAMFEDVALTNGEEVRYTWFDGENVEVTVSVQVEPLVGVENVDNYVFLIINPDTGEYAFIPLKNDKFNSETGEVVVKLPMLGSLALLEGPALPYLDAEYEILGSSFDIPNGWHLEIQSLKNEELKTGRVVEVTEEVNNPVFRETPKETVADLYDLDLDDAEAVAAFEAENDHVLSLLDLYDYFCIFRDVVLVNDDLTESRFSWEGEDIPARIKLQLDELIGEKEPEKYVFLLINPETNAYDLLPLTEQEFDPATGEIILNLPHLGCLSLLKLK